MVRHKTIWLNPSSIKKAITELKAYEKGMDKALEHAISRLATEGAMEAALGFKSAHYDGVNDAVVYEKRNRYGARIVATGEAVPFIEFGTGVYSEGGGRPSYPLRIPNWVVPLGTYGQGKGVNPQGWKYLGFAGTNGIQLKGGAILTKGNPAQMPLGQAYVNMQYQAPLELKKAVEAVVR